MIKVICPKCGSEEVLQNSENENKFMCAYDDCSYVFEVDFYQQRLSMVLKKFEIEDGTDGIVSHYCKGLLKITYYAHTKYFMLDRQGILLDTVEYLIRDMEMKT